MPKQVLRDEFELDDWNIESVLDEREIAGDDVYRLENEEVDYYAKIIAAVIRYCDDFATLHMRLSVSFLQTTPASLYFTRPML